MDERRRTTTTPRRDRVALILEMIDRALADAEADARAPRLVLGGGSPSGAAAQAVA